MGLSFGATTALADYGLGAVYQVELSANTPVNGFWFWAELSPDGTGDYQETDCIHLGSGGPNGAIHASGTLKWTVAGGVLTLSNVKIIGGLETVTITIPVNAGVLGHYSSATLTVTGAAIPFPPIPVGASLTLPAQVQVAP